MSDEQLHLFNEERWQQPAREQRPAREHCCKQWAEILEGRLVDGTGVFVGFSERLIEVVHMLGHSRVAFTDRYVAQQARCSIEAASYVTSRAKRLGWIKPPRKLDGAVRESEGRMWIGALPRRG